MATVPEESRAEALLDEISRLYALILRVARRVHDDDAPLTATQRHALIEVSKGGPLRLRTLAARLETTPATATRAVDALEDWGFVKRCPDEHDKRGVIVRATRRGSRWASRREAALLDVLEQLPQSAIPERLLRDLDRLNRELRAVTGHDEIAEGLLRAPARGDTVR